MSKMDERMSLKSLCSEIIKYLAFLVPTNVFLGNPIDFSRTVDGLILGLSAIVLLPDMWGDARVP